MLKMKVSKGNIGECWIIASLCIVQSGIYKVRWIWIVCQRCMDECFMEMLLLLPVQMVMQPQKEVLNVLIKIFKKVYNGVDK